VQRQFRLTRSTDFKRVRRFGKSYAHPLIVLIVSEGEDSRTRIGVAAGRSVGGAVRRNRAKRLLREAVRPLIPLIITGKDLLLVARFPLPDAKMQAVRTTLESLLQRAELLNQNHEA
jgi:ribonuclease P protein component